MEAAKIILTQLCQTLGSSVILSWAFNRPVPVYVDGLSGLSFNVSGRLFKGKITVLLNWDDTYIIQTQKAGETETKTLCESCYCDDFGSIIDKFVEVGDDWDEYEKFLLSEKEKLQDMGITENTEIIIFG